MHENLYNSRMHSLEEPINISASKGPFPDVVEHPVDSPVEADSIGNVRTGLLAVVALAVEQCEVAQDQH